MLSFAFNRRACLAFVLTGVVVLLSGCGMGVKAPTGAGIQGGALKGGVHGGQQPIVGARVYLFAAGTAGYGNSNLNSSILNTSASNVLTDGDGNGYVPTGAGGFFDITGDWDSTCLTHAGQQIYIVALGGNPGLGPGTDNSGIALMAALGECENVVANYSFINLNELSTVAAVWALQQFMGSNGVQFLGTTSTNLTGMANAFQLATNLVDVGSGAALTKTPGGHGDVPQTELNTLGNILASCINTDGITITDTTTEPGTPLTTCGTLFYDATPSGGTAPADTIMAAWMIAQNPANNVAVLNSLQTPQAPFTPKFPVGSPPNDWSVAIQYTGAGISTPQDVAIDALGDVWVTDALPDSSNNYYISRVTPLGEDATSGGGYTNLTIIHPSYIAFDTSGNLWSASASCNNIPDGFGGFGSSSVCVTEMDGNGNDLTGGSGVIANAVQGIGGIAPDGSGNMWFTSSSNNGNALYEFSNGSFTGYASPSSSGTIGLSNPNGVAVDSNGRIWVANSGTDPNSDPGNMDIFTGLGENGPLTVPNMDSPFQVTLDSNGYAWFTNSIGPLDSFTPTISVMDFGGDDITATGGLHTGFASGGQIAIDGLDNAWVLDFNASPPVGQFGFRLVELSGFNSVALGTVMTGANGLQTSYITTGAQSFAIDGSGNIWVSNQDTPGSVSGLVEFVGVAGPVMTPVAAQIQNSLIGLEP